VRCTSRDRRSRHRPTSASATNASGGTTSVVVNAGPRRNDTASARDGALRTRMGRICAASTLSMLPVPTCGAAAAPGGTAAAVGSAVTESSNGCERVST